MNYQIDQSGKIEHTDKLTVIGYSNGSQKAVVLPAKVKRQLQEEFRSLGLTKVFVYHIFAVGVYFLIKDFRQEQQIVIDLEYPGKDEIIKDMLTKLLCSHNKPEHDVTFSRIGNHPKAHYVAKDVFDGKKKADIKVSFEEAIRAISRACGPLRQLPGAGLKKSRWAFKRVSFNSGRRSASACKRILSKES